MRLVTEGSTDSKAAMPYTAPSLLFSTDLLKQTIATNKTKHNLKSTQNSRKISTQNKFEIKI